MLDALLGRCLNRPRNVGDGTYDKPQGRTQAFAIRPGVARTIVATSFLAMVIGDAPGCACRWLLGNGLNLLFSSHPADPTAPSAMR